ncbi:MAG: hypothetical protein ABSD49_08030 [Candidatus Bathyarchaeia archaeon]
MCDHCDVLTGVLTQLCGAKVAQVIMKRAVAELHGHEATLVQREISRLIIANPVS